VNPGKHLGFGLGPLGFQQGLHIADILAPLLQNAYYVIAGTAAEADQHRLHGTHAHVATTRFRRAIHDDGVTAAGLTQKHGPVHPLARRFHSTLPLQLWCCWRQRKTHWMVATLMLVFVMKTAHNHFWSHDEPAWMPMFAWSARSSLTG